jgi:hypothetical protein
MQPRGITLYSTIPHAAALRLLSLLWFGRRVSTKAKVKESPAIKTWYPGARVVHFTFEASWPWFGSNASGRSKDVDEKAEARSGALNRVAHKAIPVKHAAPLSMDPSSFF